MPIRRPSRTTLAGLVVALLAVVPLHAGADTLDKIRETGVLAIGYREASVPFSYLGTDQKPVGFSLELCQAIAAKLRSDLKIPIEVKMVAVNASNRIPLLQNGSIDLECGSTTNTAERQKQVAFSVATFVSTPTWVVSNASGIRDASALKGKTVVATQGSLNLTLVKKIDQDTALNLDVVQTKEHGESLLMVRTGRAAAWFEDDVLEAGMVASAPDARDFRFLSDNYGGYFYYGLMLRAGDPAFKSAVDGVLKTEMASGRYAALYDKWFTRPIEPNGQNLNLPMSAPLKARVAMPSDALTP